MGVSQLSATAPGLAARLQAAFGAFLAPERLMAPANDNPNAGVSLADPLALPPDWHQTGDLLGLSLLPFDGPARGGT